MPGIVSNPDFGVLVGTGGIVVDMVAGRLTVGCWVTIWVGWPTVGIWVGLPAAGVVLGPVYPDVVPLEPEPLHQ